MNGLQNFSDVFFAQVLVLGDYLKVLLSGEMSVDSGAKKTSKKFWRPFISTTEKMTLL